MKKNLGFTLVELIVMITILGILGVVISDILIQTLRAQNKVKVINQVKQNGQVVLDKMTNDIRQAVIIYPCVDTNRIVLKKDNDVYTRFRLVVPTASANGYFAQEDFTSVADPTPAVLCNLPVPSTSRNLSDKDTLNGISVDLYNLSPVFDVQSSAGTKEIVTITFGGKQGVGVGTAYDFAVKEGGILFTTTVQRRADSQSVGE